ncbi:MAG: DUF1778 domain-containing protein [Polyangiaceae bacterium]
MGTKTAQLQIRVSEEEKEAIREAAGRAGLDLSSFVLSRVLPPPPRNHFVRLVNELARDAAPAPQRLALAALNDFLSSLAASEWESAVAMPVAAVLSPMSANYVAAMIETAARMKSLPVPEWVAAVAPLQQPWFASQLKSLRLHLLLHSPPAFRKRNLFVDASVGARV